MVDQKVLKEILKERYDAAHKHLLKTKEELPDEYKGFVDEDLKDLEKVYSDLQKDVNFYSLEPGHPDNVIRSFKIHCGERFIPFLIECTSERILDYGITYAEYISPEKQH